MENMQYELEIIKDINMTGEIIKNCKFIDCNFENCKFDNTELINCTFIDCRFYKTILNNIHSDNSISKRSEFIKCNIIAIDWNSFLPKGNIQEPIYKLEDCLLKFNNFIKIKFKKFDFSNNEIIESIFEECMLVECKFINCNLDNTIIVKSNINKSNFIDATGYSIDVLSNKMEDAKFSFPEVVSLLDSLKIDIKY